MSFLFIKAFAQILHEFTKLCFYEKGHKKELGSGYKTDTIIFSFFVVTRHFSLQYTKDKWVTCDDKAHRQ